MPISFSHVQGVGVANSDPCTLVLSSVPTEGNLLVSGAMERSGGSGDNFTITGIGWTKRESLTVLQMDTTFRRSMAIWTKVANGEESDTIVIDDGTSNNKTAFVHEYSHGGDSADWCFEASVSNDNGATSNANSISTSTTASISAGDLLEIGICAIKRGASTRDWSSSWTNNLSERANYSNLIGVSRQLIIGDYLLDTGGGTKESTVSNSGDLATTNDGLMAALVVFSAAEGADSYQFQNLSLSQIGFKRSWSN